MTVSLLDALACPFCGGPLFKESYYLRCERDHRFRSGIQRGRTAEAAQGAPENGAPAPRAIQLRVIWHPDRREVGRLFTFPIPDGAA